jgi:hypothetical protein
MSKIEYPDGRLYIGKVFHGTPHGLGHMTYPCGSSYKGEFLFGLLHGRGHYVFFDGSEYNGEFSNGLKHGHGLIKESPISTWVEVEFINDIKKREIVWSEESEATFLKIAKKDQVKTHSEGFNNQKDPSLNQYVPQIQNIQNSTLQFKSVNSNKFTPIPHPDELKPNVNSLRSENSEFNTKEQAENIIKFVKYQE